MAGVHDYTTLCIWEWLSRAIWKVLISVLSVLYNIAPTSTNQSRLLAFISFGLLYHPTYSLILLIRSVFPRLCFQKLCYMYFHLFLCLVFYTGSRLFHIFFGGQCFLVAENQVKPVGTFHLPQTSGKPNHFPPGRKPTWAWMLSPSQY